MAERNQLVNIEAHGVSNADDHFEIGLDGRDLAGLFQNLNVAASVRERARLLVGVRRGKNDIGDGRGFRQEHVLHHKKCVLQRGRVHAQPSHRICADYV